MKTRKIKKKTHVGTPITERIRVCRLLLKKRYATSEGYMGLVQGRYMLFASEVDYREYMED